MIKAAIFDMDGLLIDSEPFWRKSHVEALAEYDVTITEDDVRKMAGQRTDEVVRHWRETYNLTHIPNELLEESIVRRVMENITLKGQELPGVRSLIMLFNEHAIPMAVASSSAPEVIETVLVKLGLKDEMQFAYSAKYEPFGKPHPGVFLTTAEKLNVDVSDCVVFEDSLSGIRAAKSANMKCVAVPEEANMNKPEFTQEADIVMSTLEHVDWPTLTALFSKV
jgi:beta-phosphoglucomutase-like phosphatase (HAD superfamily)